MKATAEVMNALKVLESDGGWSVDGRQFVPLDEKHALVLCDPDIVEVHELDQDFESPKLGAVVGRVRLVEIDTD